MFDRTSHSDAIVSDVLRAISDHKSGVYKLAGVSPNAVSGRVAELVQSAEQVGVVLFFVTSENDELTGLIRNAMQRAQEHGAIDDALLELADSAGNSNDSRFRLWSELTSKFRHAVVVASERIPGWVEEFSQRCYSDPIAEIDPELASFDSMGALFVVGDFPGVKIDCSNAAREVVRETLQNEAIVEKVAATTGGDVAAVNHLVEHLEAHQHNINFVRFQAASVEEQRLVEILAVAHLAIDTSLLQSVALRDMDQDQFGRAFRKLIADGVLSRVIHDGRVQVALRDNSIRDRVLAGIEPARLVEIHTGLAEGELAQNSHIADPVFVATQFIAAKDSRAIPYVFQAVPLLAARGLVESALQQLAAVEDFATGSERQKIAGEVVELTERSGNFIGAIQASRTYIDDYPDDRNAKAKLAKLYYRAGQLKNASEVLDGLVELGEVDFDLRLLRVDVAHGLGNHDQVIVEVASILEELERSEVSDAAQARARLRATNALARVDFFRRNYTEAQSRWETNRSVAADWGWRKEIARADVNLGVLAMELGANADAKRRFEQALELADLQHVVERACLVNLAMLHQKERGYADALAYGLEAMRVAKRSGDVSGFAVASRNLASVYSTVGAYDRAQRMMTFLRDNYEFDSTTLNGAWNVLVDSEIAFDEHRFEDAIKGFSPLIEGNLSSIFSPRASLRSAYASLKLGNRAEAVDALSSHEFGESKEIDALAMLIDAELTASEDTGEAIEKARIAISACQKHGKVADAARARFLLASLLIQSGKPDHALEEVQKELRYAEELSRQIPESMRTSFFRRPDYQQLVALLRDLQGVVPVTFETESNDAMASRSRYSNFIGEDEGLQRIFRIIDKVAASDATVLIYGESGTGKELVAEAMHMESHRQHKPFVKVNCAALVEDLLLSELFGHEKGAFTGAVERKIGRFELADGGTIFLDEIGDISPNTQVALLRVLQEKTFERVGGSETQTANVRVVCATNRSLEALVEQGLFRLDLYYRLKGVVIETPPLRERRGDIGRLAQHFASSPESGAPKRISASAIQELARYSWPGNIRELQNFIRSVVLFVDGDTIERRHIDDFRDFFVSGTIDRTLPKVKVDYLDTSTLEESSSTVMTTVVQEDLETALVERMIEGGESLADMKKKLEIECIKGALLKSGGNVTKAAEILKMKRPRLSQIIGDNVELSDLKKELIA